MSHNQLADNCKGGDSLNVKRNTFDVSTKHFASYTIGKIYPFFTRFLHPNETLTLHPNMNFELDAMAHTIKNRLTAHVRYFKVYNRALWKNWEEFIMQDKTLGTSTHTHPYISRTGAVSIGSLLNHMGVPAVAHSKSSVVAQTPLYRKCDEKVSFNGSYVDFSAYCHTIWRDIREESIPSTRETDENGKGCAQPVFFNIPSGAAADLAFLPSLGDMIITGSAFRDALSNATGKTSFWCPTTPIQYDLAKSSSQCQLQFTRFAAASTTAHTAKDFYVGFYVGSNFMDASLFMCSQRKETIISQMVRSFRPQSDRPQTIGKIITFGFTFTDAEVDKINDMRKQGKVYICFGRIPSSAAITNRDNLLTHCPLSLVYSNNDPTDKSALDYTPGLFGDMGVLTLKDTTSCSTSPFDGTDAATRLNALPLRAYRAIYNGRIRNKIFDPFCPAVNPHDSSTSTIPYVDRYVENMDDGADVDTPIEFEYALFDEDYYNGCLPSPTMMTDRPLVGVVASPDSLSASLTYNKASGGTSEQGTISLSLSNDGTQKITGITQHQGFDANHVTIDSLKDAIKVGISLQDMRNVEALTRWYQINYKSGRFSYAEFIGAHFDNMPSYNKRLRPEYLGGTDIKLSEWEVVNSTSPDTEDGAPLGKRGAMGEFKDNLPTITCHADEDCIVMGIVWFSVDNNMVDALNRQWFAQLPEDYPDPCFANLGCQAVHLREVAPLLSVGHESDIWGYNRTYGYMTEHHDTLAGDFCSSRDGEVMVRKLTSMPQLDMEFRTINPDNLTNIFVGKLQQDHIWGKFFHDAKLSTWLSQRPNAQII